MQSQYRRYLHPQGQPGVDDQFYRMIVNSSPSRVERIDLPIDRDTNEFLDFPDDARLADFDPSDRVFAVAARVSGVPVSNATDSDWLNHYSALSDNGISVEFLCGRDPSSWTLTL